MRSLLPVIVFTLSLPLLWSQGETMAPNQVYEAKHVGIVVATIVPRTNGLMRRSVVGWIADERKDLEIPSREERSTARIVAADTAHYSDNNTNIPYASITFVVVPGQFWMVHDGQAGENRADVKYYPLSIAVKYPTSSSD